MLVKFKISVFYVIIFILTLSQGQVLFSNSVYSQENEISPKESNYIDNNTNVSVNSNYNIKIKDGFNVDLVSINERKYEPVGTILKFKAVCKGEDLIYKWSIYRDSNELYTKEYSEENVFEYPTTEIGVYKVGVAVQNKYGEILRKESEEIEIYSKEDLEKVNAQNFVNEQNFSSKTDYFIWVDTEKNLVYVFKGKTNNWVLEKTMVCTDGKASTPTIKGNFSINGRAPWLTSYNKKVKAKYKVRFYGNYYFHSILYDSKGKNIVDSRLGQSLSHGCVRLSVENAKWIYDNISDGTGVYIN